MDIKEQIWMIDQALKKAQMYSGTKFKPTPSAPSMNQAARLADFVFPSRFDAGKVPNPFGDKVNVGKLHGQDFSFNVVVKYNNLPKFAKKWRDEAAFLSEECAFAIVEEAENKAPLGTRDYTEYPKGIEDYSKTGGGAIRHPGYLKRSIGAEPIRRLQWRVFVGAYYAVFVEYGTARMAARPFWVPAVEKAYREYKHNMEKMLKDHDTSVKDHRTRRGKTTGSDSSSDSGSSFLGTDNP